MTLTRPKLLSLDSGILGKLARDFYSRNAHSGESARRFLAALDTNGWILFLTWHQFHELIKHRDEDIARERIAFLSSRPMMCWLAGSDPPYEPGTIADVFHTELSIALEHPDHSLKAVSQAVKAKRLRFGTGAQAIEPSIDAWWAMRPRLWESEERHRVISSISQARVLDNSDEPLANILNGSVRAREGARARLNALGAALAAELKVRGDRRMRSPEAAAMSLIDETHASCSPLYTNAENPIGAWLETLGIARSELDPCGTLRDVFELAHFRQLLRNSAQRLGIAWETLRTRIQQDRIPTWVVQRAFRRHRAHPHEAQGGDLTDMYLLCFGLYVDLNVVDKRTLDNYERARRKEPTAIALLAATEKTPNYEALIPRLAQGMNRS